MLIEVCGDLDGLRPLFEATLRRQCAELSIGLDLVGGRLGAPTVNACVTVIFPGTGTRWTASESDEFAHLANAGSPVLPVIDSAPEAALLPTALARFNAFQTGIWGSAWSAGLVDEVLSLGWQRRRERRVFISYKRSDSGPVARQLYDALTGRGYIVFLDDISIGKGLDFQGELKWWLNDADVLLVLVTPGFGNSKWCMQEINSAKSGGIGVLGLQWPCSVSGSSPTRAFPSVAAPSAGKPPASVATGIDADQLLSLYEADFTGAPSDPLWEQELTDDGLTKVLAHCAWQRAIAIRLRLENLIPLAQHVLKPSGGLQPTGMPGDFTFVDSAGEDYFVRLLPFRPDARAVHEAFLSAGSQRNVGCLYSESDVNDPRAAAMRWLITGLQNDVTPPRRRRIWTCMGDKDVS